MLKSADRYLRLVFITGVTKFAQMSVFSELNQLTDISQLPQYATLCGMTRTEITDNFAPEIEELAQFNQLTTEEAMEKLTRMYDLLSVMSYKVFKNYWFVSGTPTFLVEMLKRTDYDLRDLDGIEVSSASLFTRADTLPLRSTTKDSRCIPSDSRMRKYAMVFLILCFHFIHL